MAKMRIIEPPLRGCNVRARAAYRVASSQREDWSAEPRRVLIYAGTDGTCE